MILLPAHRGKQRARRAKYCRSLEDDGWRRTDSRRGRPLCAVGLDHCDVMMNVGTLTQAQTALRPVSSRDYIDLRPFIISGQQYSVTTISTAAGSHFSSPAPHPVHCSRRLQWMECAAGEDGCQPAPQTVGRACWIRWPVSEKWNRTPLWKTGTGQPGYRFTTLRQTTVTFPASATFGHYQIILLDDSGK